jgi:hypothetical protein
MPPRLLVLAIVLFWIGTSAWLFQRELWPRLRSGEAPPFAIDLADETRPQSAAVRWTIIRGKSKIGVLETWTSYRKEDNTFELHSKIKSIYLGGIGPMRAKATNLESMYRVTQDGVLRATRIDGELQLLQFSAYLYLTGKIDGRWFTPRGYVALGRKKEVSDKIQIPENEKIYLDLERVPVSARGSVIDPLHPVNRIRGLRPGQRWQTPLIDPLADSFNGMVQKEPALQALPMLKKSHGTPILYAEVLGGPRQIEYGGLYWGCLVIEYRGDDMTAHTWVRESDGLVLKQDALFWGDHLILERN